MPSTLPRPGGIHRAPTALGAAPPRGREVLNKTPRLAVVPGFLAQIGKCASLDFTVSWPCQETVKILVMMIVGAEAATRRADEDDGSAAGRGDPGE